MSGRRYERERLAGEVMAPSPVALPADATAAAAAAVMRDAHIGDVLVTDAGSLYGIVTDRDLVVRVVAFGLEADRVSIGTIATTMPVTATVDTPLSTVEGLMREHKVRRMPVLDRDGAGVGVVSLADLAMERRDPQSPLANIGASQPNT